MKRLAKLLIAFTIFICSTFFYIGYTNGYITFGYQPSTAKMSVVPTPKPLSAEIIENLVNDYREENGLPRLIHDPELCKLAEVRAEEIKTDWSHAGFEERWGTFEYSVFGENLGSGFLTERAFINAWKKSKSHNAGMLDTEVDRTCVATSGSYAVQLFIKY